MATIKKITKLKGTKITKDGRFVDMPYCPYCKRHVESLMQCLKENHS